MRARIERAQGASGLERFRPSACLVGDLTTLAKARVNLLVVATAFVGFALHAKPSTDWLLLVHTLGGTGLIAASAAVANQIRERRHDCMMDRTRYRPLAAGRLRPIHAVAWCAFLFVAGSMWLEFGVNRKALGFAVLAFAVYTMLYTPLKRRSPACTIVGAVAGALPVLTGWAATDTPLGFWAIIAFTFLFVWQIPHFLAIARWRRADYQRAGFHVLPAQDEDGRVTARWTITSVIVLTAISLLPLLRGHVLWWYAPAATLSGAALFVPTWRFWKTRTEAAARRLFQFTLIYLPVVYVLMLLTANTRG